MKMVGTNMKIFIGFSQYEIFMVPTNMNFLIKMVPTNIKNFYGESFQPILKIFIEGFNQY